MRGRSGRSGPAPGAAGFFGKVPGQGDFVASRFDRALREPLDRWAQAALAHCRRSRGEAWGRDFLAMPPYRFVLGAALVGGQPAIGVMVPSADRVGRPFPLFLGARLADHRGPTRALARQRRWFDDAEALALGARGAVLPLEDLDRKLAALKPEPLASASEGETAGRETDRSFWWTDGRGGVPRRFAANGFPAPEDFDRFLDGERETPEHADSSVSQGSDPPAPPSAIGAEAATKETPSRAIVSAQSHAGTRLRVNADAVLASEAEHLFAIVGGRGSLQATPVAARLVTERLARLAPHHRIADLASEVKGELGNANTLLRRDGGGVLPEGGIAVVALALAPDGFAALWAGDMRCYLLREGMMRCLTRDHVGIGLERRLSRSLGGSAQFACEVSGGAALPDDLFLISSASLTRVLAERDIAARLLAVPPQEAARGLVEDALVAGVRENVSAVVVALR